MRLKPREVATNPDVVKADAIKEKTAEVAAPPVPEPPKVIPTVPKVMDDIVVGGVYSFLYDKKKAYCYVFKKDTYAYVHFFQKAIGPQYYVTASNGLVPHTEHYGIVDALYVEAGLTPPDDKAGQWRLMERVRAGRTPEIMEKYTFEKEMSFKEYAEFVIETTKEEIARTNKARTIVSGKYTLLVPTGDRLLTQEGSGCYFSKANFMLMNEENDFAREWYSCKDYFNDTMYSLVNKDTGRGYMPKGTIKMDNFRILVSQPGLKNEFAKRILVNSVNFANDLLAHLKIKERVKILCWFNDEDNKKEYRNLGLFIHIPEFIASAGPLLALALMCIRTGYVYTKKDKKDIESFIKRLIEESVFTGVDGSDQQYWKSVLAKAIPYIKNGNPYEIFGGTLEDKWKRKVYTIHSDFGIVAFSQNLKTPFYSRWEKK